MILTVTPNPAIDRVFFLRNFRLGAIIRARREVFTPSGKGVDASLVIHELGGETVATGFVAGLTGNLLTGMLDARGVRHAFVTAQGETRTVVILVDEAVTEQSTVSAPTLTATPGHLDELLAVLDRFAESAWGVVLAGSLPPGLPMDGYAHLLRHARRRGIVTLLDTSGEWLRQGVEGLPCILKINRDELASLAAEATDLESDPCSDVTGLIGQLRPYLGEWASDAIVISLGAAGALAVTCSGIYHAQSPAVSVVSTAGAGDALAAGVLLARSREAEWPDALGLGTAAAASVVMNEGTAICRREQVTRLLSDVRIIRHSL